ncbi:S8 family serine peptidase [Nocardiopsis mangrovi]|uniref:S8 family serine peptidase n=1 Tax=Nocardiopsis mangrovi TaxID=1179818 RepID=A0ABV9DV19_9ACTN
MRTSAAGTRPARAAGAAAAAAALAVVLAPPAAGDTGAELRVDQWGMAAVGAADPAGETPGEGITIAVLGSGVDDGHPDLRDTVTIGRDFTGQDRAPGDDGYGGSTGTAGIIAASGHGREFTGGIIGVAPAADILSVRVEPGAGDPDPGAVDTAAALADGIRYAAGEGVQVITLPESAADGAAADPGVQEAIDTVARRGVLVVVPAAGSGAAAPAAATGDTAGGGADEDGSGPGPVLTVGAFDEDLLLTADSPRSDSVTLAAPGAGVEVLEAGEGYTTADGTGPAAAFVAGAAALVRAEHPQLLPGQVAGALIEGAAAPSDGGGPGYGAGLLDVPGALEAAGTTAEDIPLYDEDLAAAADDPFLPPWAMWTGAAVLALLLAATATLLVRRSTADPYGLSSRRRRAEAGAAADTGSGPQAAAPRGHRRRGGSRRKR